MTTRDELNRAADLNRRIDEAGDPVIAIDGKGIEEIARDRDAALARVAAAEAMADAYDAWDASENEKFTHEVWQKRQRLCAAFMDARDALRALSPPPPHDGEGAP